MAVTGGKGGVGKSNIAVNLAVQLGKLGRSVLVLDADLGLANIDVLCGLQPQGTLEDVFNGKETLDDILLRIDENVSLLPATSGATDITSLGQVEYGGLIQAFSNLREPIDTLIIDTPAGISSQVTAFCRAAREVVVVMCDEPTSITDAYAMIKVLSTEFNVKRINILVNKASSSQHGIDLFEKIERVADKNFDVMLSYLGTVPHDERLQQAVCDQNPVVTSYPRSRSALAFQKLAKRIHGWPEPKQPIGHVEFFVERLVSYSSSAGITE
ncbi:cobyrinic acid a,c-diamide synthase [Chromatiales bacterium (ex Bugula neritina AB1)]|nr:cobyrinic acid a,c-diamide synthase [Chromatiales bacterium (ex Bugula neritina AB1)]